MNNIRDLNTGSMWRAWGIRGLAALLAMSLLVGMVLVPPAETFAQGQETECPECGGDGKVTIPENAIPCPHCDGKTMHDCASCSNDGSDRICKVCNGKGRLLPE